MFPELGFLHKSSFSRDLKRAREHRDHPVEESRLTVVPARQVVIALPRAVPSVEFLAAALVATCPRSQESSQLSEEFLTLLQSSVFIDDGPDIYIVQTLLVTAMHEWGRGHVYRAWMYSGELE
jgi:hypothetical protein